MLRQASNGNTLAEYALMLGLVTVLSIVALKTLGQSNFNLLAAQGGTLQSQSVQDMVNLKFNGTSATSNTSGLITPGGGGAQGLNPNGSPIMVEGNSGGTNATSVDGHTGTQATSYSLTLAKRLEDLIESEEDPDLQSKLRGVAYQAYFLSAAEANYEYGRDPNQNSKLKELASLVELEGFPTEENPELALVAIRNKMGQVGVKAQAYLDEPSASPETKALVRQLSQEIVSLADKRYSEADQAMRETDRFKNTISKLAALPNTEDNASALKPAAFALLGDTSKTPDHQGTITVKTTVRDGSHIEQTADDLKR